MSRAQQYGPWAVITGASDGIGLAIPVKASAASPDVVAESVCSALGRKTTVVPGAQGKFLTASLKTLPRPVRSAVLARVVESMRNTEGT